MFERFTDRARRVVVLAQEIARQLGSPAIDTAHLLLACIEEGEGVAAKVLADFGVDKREVLDTINLGAPGAAGHIPHTDEAKKALEMSLREALQLGHNYIGTEHILLGLVREGSVEPLVPVALFDVRYAVLAKLLGYAETKAHPDPQARAEAARKAKESRKPASGMVCNGRFGKHDFAVGPTRAVCNRCEKAVSL